MPAIENKLPPQKRYDLTPLMTGAPLTWDAEDGIESVNVVMLKLKDLAGYGRIQVESPAQSVLDLHEYSREYFGGHCPLASGAFIPTQAKIIIRFHPDKKGSRSNVLPINITLPNGCDLLTRTSKEKLVGEKYLKRWGLLNDIHG
ncbi:hypothetical protein ONV78_31265 [Hahella sp. CR1]|uniref:hypothetical protein n=1 Tax=Hahella sp. CR1 TaxID=2992807 RepID=UPI00244313A6|nr:hypothetical protein [Hahella sp. CR1]MDG9672253.1 hypothetical protein [Hahella sp. CR1]